MPMTMSAKAEKVLKKWADGERAKLSERVLRQVGRAITDLYFGPISTFDYDEEEDDDDDYKGEWTGFQSACDEIKKELDDKCHTTTVWVDMMSEEVLTDEPQPYKTDNPDYDPDDEESPKTIMVDPDWGDIYKFESSEVIVAILRDRELPQYL